MFRQVDIAEFNLIKSVIGELPFYGCSGDPCHPGVKYTVDVDNRNVTVAKYCTGISNQGKLYYLDDGEITSLVSKGVISGIRWTSGTK